MAGQLRVDEITDEAGTGSPSFPQGIQPNSLGTGTPGAGNFLRGDGVWEAVPPGSTPGQLELLQEDIFTTSGTFTKATGFDDDDTVMMFLIGGGGSGGAAVTNTTDAVAAGGSGGNCTVLVGPYSQVPSSVVFLVGAGGASSTQAGLGNSQGNSGGVTALRDDANTFNLSAGSGGIAGGADGPVAGFSFHSQVLGFSSYTNAFYNDKPTGRGVRPFAKQFFGGGTFVIRSDGLTENTQAGFVTQNGGSASRAGATNNVIHNDYRNIAIFSGGGLGSGTANGQNATGIGCGGGGCCRQNANATSGAGFSGAVVVRYFRGRVSIDQALQIGA